MAAGVVCLNESPSEKEGKYVGEPVIGALITEPQ